MCLFALPTKVSRSLGTSCHKGTNLEFTIASCLEEVGSWANDCFVNTVLIFAARNNEIRVVARLEKAEERLVAASYLNAVILTLQALCSERSEEPWWLRCVAVRNEDMLLRGGKRSVVVD